MKFFPQMRGVVSENVYFYTLSVSPELKSGITNEGGYPFPIFTERPFIRPLSRRGQLHTMFRYVQMNPQRLATKRLKPGFFRVQKDIEIGERKYDGGKHHISRSECVALNAMAEEICNGLNFLSKK